MKFSGGNWQRGCNWPGVISRQNNFTREDISAKKCFGEDFPRRGADFLG